MSSLSCREFTQLTFEWTVTALKGLFETSSGINKSRAYKSPRFGQDGQWQILFYPNAGTSKEGQLEGTYSSLFLSSEPTNEELDRAVMNDGSWNREGIYKFSFEIRTLNRQILFNQKEASNHIFSHKTANWGWAQFARRDVIFYGSAAARTDDSFIIVCTITSSPQPPTSPLAYATQSVPRDLLETVGRLLDDPNYSDVKFIIPESPHRLKSIYASKRLLQRAEYFQNMFGSDFAEGAIPSHSDRNEFMSTDSDTEDYFLPDMEDSDCESATSQEQESHKDETPKLSDDVSENDGLELLTTALESSSVGGEPQETPTEGVSMHSPLVSMKEAISVSHPMSKVTIRDASYRTFFAILYYIYTDSIYFAPLSSSFLAKLSTSTTLHSEQHSASNSQPSPSGYGGPDGLRSSRREWIQRFEKQHPGKPVCSAKACYRLADRLGLQELKEKAAHHIKSSLTVDNVVLEIFSPFTAMFSEIRQFEVEFFLEQWSVIRTSTAMQQVWKQIRHGRHPGYEEVWPVIAMNLEFKPQSKDGSGPSGTGHDA